VLRQVNANQPSSTPSCFGHRASRTLYGMRQLSNVAGGSDRLHLETACRQIGAPQFCLRRTSSSGADHG
jgi:hypothetical protein